MRPYPSIDVFCQLVENIMADGLETSSEPLLVIQPDELVDNNVEMSWPGLPAHEAPLKGFSIGYTKGMARMCTALSLLHWIWENGIDIKEGYPELYESFRAVHIHHTKQATKMDEAIDNMKISCRGSIRKAPNVLQIAVMSQRLHSYGYTDFSVFVRKWNASCPRASQILGKKALALKMLLALERDQLQLILDHVNQCGMDQSVWMDEALANKKLYRDHQFPAKGSKRWLPRLKTCSESVTLAIKRIQNTFEMAPNFMKN